MVADQPVLLITGASSGIGTGTARQAVATGHRVVLGARSQDKPDAPVEALGGPDVEKLLIRPTAQAS